MHLVGFLQPRITMHGTTNIEFIPNCYRDRAVWIYKYMNSKWMVKKKRKKRFYFNFPLTFQWQFCYAEMTDFFFTVHDKRSKISPSPSVHFATRVRRSRVVSSELIVMFLYAGSNIQNASEQPVSCVHLSLVNFALHLTPQTKISRS